jgi:SulP family sulfate permease
MAALINLFDYGNDPQRIEIDLIHSHIRDQSAVTVITREVDKYPEQGKSGCVTRLNPGSEERLDKGFS